MSNHTNWSYADGGLTVPNNGTLENYLVDMGGINDQITVNMHGTNQTMRYMGFEGALQHTGALVGVSDQSGGTSVIEHCHFRCDLQGNRGTGEDRGINIWVSPQHNGTLIVRNCYFDSPINNAIYGSAPGSNSNGQRGEVIFENCYERDSHHTGFRCSDHNDRIEGCVSYKSGNHTAVRNAWIWESPDGGSHQTIVRDCDFIQNGSAGRFDMNGAPNVRAENLQMSDWSLVEDNPNFSADSASGTNPEHYVPAGCPQTPLDAAEGNVDDGGGSDPEPDPDPAEGLIAHDSMSHTGMDIGGYGFGLWTETGGSVANMRIDGVRLASSPDPEPTPPGVYENWPNGETDLNKYIGDTENYSVPNVANNREGEYALQADGTHSSIMNHDGEGPTRGTTFGQSLFIASGEENNARAVISFAAQENMGDNPHRYGIMVDHDQGTLEFGVNDGSWTWPSSGSVSFDTTNTESKWNDLYVDFGENQSDVIRYWYDTQEGNTLAEGSVQNTLHDGGGWGYAMWTTSSSSVAGWLDYLRDESEQFEPDPPAAPTNLRSPSQTSSSIDLAWDHSPDYDS